MHPVLVQEQNFAHFPEETNHVMPKSQRQQSSSRQKQRDSEALSSKTQEQYEQTKFQQSCFRNIGLEK